MDFDFESRSTASRRDDAERPATSWPAMASAGRVTDIGAAVRDALQGEPPVAIVLVTDGRHTGRDDPRDAAREAGERRIPLLVVGVGDSSRPRTVRVAGVYSRPQVWKDEPFEIETLITSIEPGVANFEVSLWRRTLSVTDEEELQRIDSVSLAVPPGHAPLRHRFRQSLAETGRYQYVVKVAPIDGETELEDNQRESAPIAVLERDQLRVLAIAGEATWEYQQVERWLAASRRCRAAAGCSRRRRSVPRREPSRSNAFPSPRKSCFGMTCCCFSIRTRLDFRRTGATGFVDS